MEFFVLKSIMEFCVDKNYGIIYLYYYGIIIECVLPSHCFLYPRDEFVGHLLMLLS